MQTLQQERTATLSELVARDGIRFILATFVDMTGKPCAKLVPVEAVEMLETEGVGFAGYAAGALGQRPSDPDLITFPDPASYTPLHEIKPGLAMVQCDPYVNGVPWPYAPRNILRAALARLATRGMTAQIGAEAEYFLVKRAGDGTLSVADDKDRSARPCYLSPPTSPHCCACPEKGGSRSVPMPTWSRWTQAVPRVRPSSRVCGTLPTAPFVAAACSNRHPTNL
jgi:glutamine synthetase